MTVDAFIHTIEEDYLEEALEKLAKSPKDLILIYLNAKEFSQAKMMRGNTVAETDHTDKDITIQVVDNTSHTDVQ